MIVVPEVKCLNTKDENGKQPSYQDRVYDPNGIATALCCFAPDLMILERNKMNKDERFTQAAVETFESNDCRPGDTIDAYNQRVNRSGISPTITTRPEGFKTAILPVVESRQIVAMRGRNPDNPSDRTVGVHTEQRLEKNSQGLCNTLTSVQKDNMVLEKQNRIITLGNYNESEHNSSRIVDTDGIAPTVMECHGTVTGVLETQTYYRIRKLTPRECWRLMGFEDEDFNKAEKVNSNSQLYKQAGNSIVVNVLMGIFRELM